VGDFFLDVQDHFLDAFRRVLLNLLTSLLEIPLSPQLSDGMYTYDAIVSQVK
jgi:hypothetical protein